MTQETKVVFLTNKAALGAHILREMKKRNIPIEAIFIDTHRPVGLKARLQRLKRRGPIGALRAIHKRLRRTLAPTSLKMISRRAQMRLAPRTAEEWSRNSFYQSYSDKVYIVDDFNGPECEQLLKETEPDVIVLGGSRIIRKNIIDIPKIGTLNAHLGLLPKYRGVDPILWAIYQGDAVGVTVHFVDEGVDTGGIIAQKAVDITKGDTIDRLGKRVSIVAAELMAETVLKIVEGEHIRAMPQLREDGEQYYKMPSRLFRETVRKLGEMAGESEHDDGEISPRD